MPAEVVYAEPDCGTRGGRADTPSGAEVVHLVEELQVLMLRVSVVFVLAGAGLSLAFWRLDQPHSQLSTTAVVVAAASLFAGLAYVRPDRVYLWLREARWRAHALAAAGAVAVLVNGPDSPSWWIVLPMLWVVGIASSTRTTIAWALATAGAYLAGTVLGGQPLLQAGDGGLSAAAAGLVVNAVLGRVAFVLFAWFVIDASRPAPPPAPVAVPNLAATRRLGPGPRTDVRPRRRRTGGTLTVRQLEVVLLAADGLSQEEIAACLGISERQVERLRSQARERAGARTTSHLVALVLGGELR